MKPTLRSLIETMFNDLIEREKLLMKNIAEYVEGKNYDAAAKNDIKLDMIRMFKGRIIDTLNKS